MYWHKNKTNGKLYIGMTKDLDKRWSNDGKQYSKCPYFWNAIQCHSWDGFEHIVLQDNLTKEEAQKLEKSLIKEYQTQNRDYGYNIADGGAGGATVRGGLHRLSKKVYQYNLDGTFIRIWENAQRASEELRICVSDIHTACRQEKGVRKAGNYMWRYKYYDSIKPYVRLSFSRIPIAQLDVNFNIINIYDCISYVDATIYNREKVTNCCKGKSLTHNGYYWCYEDDLNNFKEKMLERLQNNVQKRQQNRTKAINQYDLQGNLLNTYISAKEVEKLTGINRHSVQAFCKRGVGNYGISTGYIWRYAEDIRYLK